MTLLDERLDAVAAAARQILPVRIGVGVGAGALTAYVFGWAAGLAWLAAFGFAEVCTRITTRPVGLGLPMSTRQRLAYMGSMFGSSLVWGGLAIVFWWTGIEAFRLTAMAVLAGMMVHAQGFSFRSPPALVGLGAAPAILWFVLPVGFGEYAGVSLVTLTLGLALLLAYVAASARANMRTAAELAEAQRVAVAANEAKSAFLAVMSHEVRTPLNGVLGMARALQRTPLDQRQQRYVETMLRSGDTLIAMLNDVLDMSKIEAGRMDLEVAAFDLRKLAEDVVELWAEAAAAKRLSLTPDCWADVPPRVLGDETRVRQIVMNLVSNALKFTEHGSVRLIMRAAPGADGDGGVEICIADTGIGLTPEQMAGLFQPFVQAETSTSRKYGGTGLGLAICRELATRMGGRIDVDSEHGQGSTFSVWLPLPAAEAEDPQDAEPEHLPALRILVADDNPINQAVARAILEAAGAVVETVADGDEALDRLRTEPFDLVLMDVHMPVMDGIEALGRIRAGQAGRADMPVVALTADAMAGEENRLKNLGFDALQTKPVQPAALISTIGEVLEARAVAGDDAASGEAAA